MADFGEFEETQPTNLDFGESGEDAFASAVASDPFMSTGGMQMQSQSADNSSPSRLKHDDYTEEELEMMAKVEEVNQERKKALYLKQTEEEQEKQQRKLAAQQALSEWKAERDS